MSERLISLGMIIAAVEAATGLTHRQIISERRTPEMIRARFTIWWLADRLTVLSAPEIADGTNRAHTSVLHGMRQAVELRDADPDFRAATDALLLTLQALDGAGRLRLALGADPVATAHRVLSWPEREAVRVSTTEIIAMARLIVEQADRDPFEPSTKETEHV